MKRIIEIGLYIYLNRLLLLYAELLLPFVATTANIATLKFEYCITDMSTRVTRVHILFQ